MLHALQSILWKPKHKDLLLSGHIGFQYYIEKAKLDIYVGTDRTASANSYVFCEISDNTAGHFTIHHLGE